MNWLLFFSLGCFGLAAIGFAVAAIKMDEAVRHLQDMQKHLNRAKRLRSM